LPEGRALYMSINHIGGRGRCSWEQRPMTVEEARSIKANLLAALEIVNQGLAEAGAED
jgi:hypothetical protein